MKQNRRSSSWHLYNIIEYNRTEYIYMDLVEIKQTIDINIHPEYYRYYTIAEQIIIEWPLPFAHLTYPTTFALFRANATRTINIHWNLNEKKDEIKKSSQHKGAMNRDTQNISFSVPLMELLSCIIDSLSNYTPYSAHLYKIEIQIKRLPLQIQRSTRLFHLL